MKLSDLSESLNSEVDVVNTTVDTTDRYVLYRSKLDTSPPIFVSIRLTNYQDLKTIADVCFYSEEQTFGVLNTFGTKGALSIFNTVIKLCENHINDVDIWFFSAKFSENANAKQFQKRTDLYDRLSERLSRKHNHILKRFSIKEDVIWVVSKEAVSDAEIVDFVNYCSNI